MTEQDIAFVHVQSFRTQRGEEALAARVQMKDGRVLFGFSGSLDASEARENALRGNSNPGLEKEPAFRSLSWLTAP